MKKIEHNCCPDNLCNVEPSERIPGKLKATFITESLPEDLHLLTLQKEPATTRYKEKSDGNDPSPGYGVKKSDMKVFSVPDPLLVEDESKNGLFSVDFATKYQKHDDSLRQFGNKPFLAKKRRLTTGLPSKDSADLPNMINKVRFEGRKETELRNEGSENLDPSHESFAKESRQELSSGEIPDDYAEEKESEDKSLGKDSDGSLRGNKKPDDYYPEKEQEKEEDYPEEKASDNDVYDEPSEISRPRVSSNLIIGRRKMVNVHETTSTMSTTMNDPIGNIEKLSDYYFDDGNTIDEKGVQDKDNETEGAHKQRKEVVSEEKIATETFSSRTTTAELIANSTNILPSTYQFLWEKILARTANESLNMTTVNFWEKFKIHHRTQSTPKSQEPSLSTRTYWTTYRMLDETTTDRTITTAEDATKKTLFFERTTTSAPKFSEKSSTVSFCDALVNSDLARRFLNNPGLKQLVSMCSDFPRSTYPTFQTNHKSRKAFPYFNQPDQIPEIYQFKPPEDTPNEKPSIRYSTLPSILLKHRPQFSYVFQLEENEPANETNHLKIPYHPANPYTFPIHTTEFRKQRAQLKRNPSEGGFDYVYQDIKDGDTAKEGKSSVDEYEMADLTAQSLLQHRGKPGKMSTSPHLHPSIILVFCRMIVGVKS